MPANINPIFALTPNIGFGASVPATAANDFDGTGVNNVLVFTAGANGSFVESVNFISVGTNIVTTARIFLNNGSTHTSASNNQFIAEQPLPNMTLTSGVPVQAVSLALNFAIPAGYTLYVGLTATVASGWALYTIAGDY